MGLFGPTDLWLLVNMPCPLFAGYFSSNWAVKPPKNHVPFSTLRVEVDSRYLATHQFSPPTNKPPMKYLLHRLVLGQAQNQQCYFALCSLHGLQMTLDRERRRLSPKD